MIVKRGSGDLNKIYRPCKIDEFVGSEHIKNMIKNALEKGNLPRVLMFTGDSGCGKTTMARIIALGLNCKEGPTGNPCCVCDFCKATLNLNSFAVIEVDSGRSGDVGHTRQVLNDLPAAPMGGERYKVVIFDEAHKLGGRAGSEDAILKFLEDSAVDHVYIIFCTNEPQKLKEVTRNRSKVIRFGRVKNNELYNILENVCQFEGYEYNSDILNYIIKESYGVPRAALSFLQLVAMEGSWTKDAASLMINAGVDVDEAEVFDLCKIVEASSFKKSIKHLESLLKTKNIPPERIRMAIAGYFTWRLKTSKSIEQADRYSAVVDFVDQPYFNNPKPDHTLINSIYKITRMLRS